MRVFDLSQPLSPSSPIYPGDEPLSLVQNRFWETDGYSAFLLRSGFHVATHIDAPAHLIAGGRGIGSYPPERFMGRGMLLDGRGREVIEAADVDLSGVEPGDIVLLYTGFDRYATADPERYFARHPSVASSLAEALVNRHISLLGLDMPSPDRPPHDIHKTLLKNDILILENISNLHALLALQDFYVISLPLKVTAEAGFVRAVAMADYK